MRKENFVIDAKALASIQVPDVKLNTLTESKAASKLTTNCGCGGTCLSTTT